VWRLPALTRTGSLTKPFDSVRDLVTSADGTLVAGVLRWGVTVWRWPSLTEVATCSGADVAPVFSPDGSLLATGSGEDVRLWHLPSGEPAATLTGHTGPVRCLVITPDGHLLASASMDGTVRLWRLPAGEPAGVLRMYEGDYYPNRYHDIPSHLVVTADGGLLVCGGQDGSLRVWRLPSGEPGVDLEGHSGQITALAVTPDGGQLATASDVGDVVRLWLPHIMVLAGTPAGRIGLPDFERLRARLGQSAAERPWIELISGLVHRRHRYDIEVGPVAGGQAAATDIEVDR
jgi:WD40 repeat protein